MKNYKDLLINTIYLFILNITLNLLIFNTIKPLALIFFILESIVFAGIIKLLGNISKHNKINKTINLILLVFISVVFTAQFVHYHFYECFFSFYSLIHSAQVFGFMEAITKVIIENIIGFLIFLGLITTFIIVTTKTTYNRNKKVTLTTLTIVIMSILIITTMIFINKGLYSPYNLIRNTHNNTENVKTFGLLTSSTIDIERYFIKFTPKVTKTKEIKKETNKYTGIFKEKNLIFITAESFNFNIIDKYLTPTLYKLMNEGITFNNYYTPIYYASTSDGEYANLTGILPTEGTWSYQESINNKYLYTYGTILKNKGYKTFSYHNGHYDFYQRNIIQKNFGYDTYKGCGNGLEKKMNCNLWPTSDNEMIKATFNDYAKSKNFMVYYMTVSGHLSHNFKTNDMAKRNKNKVQNINYSNNVKAYISANIELDKAINTLITNLKKEQLLENTVIILTPDHFPYGLNRQEISEIQTLNTSYDI